MNQNSPVQSQFWWLGVDRKWWTLAVVGAGTFMSALDGSVVNTVLPVIRANTGVAFATVTWVVLIYLLTVSATLLVFGRLADIYGQRGIYVTGLGVFTIGSLLCGLSPSVGALIGFRSLQGIGSAMTLAVGPAVLTSVFPASERGRALGLQAVMTYLGLSTGPALGGLLAQHFGWPSIFFINVPIGVFVLILGIAAITRGPAPARQPFDVPGAVTMGLSLALIIFGLSTGHAAGWGSWRVILPIAAGVLTLAVFILVDSKIEHPVLDIKLFTNRVFAASTAAAFLNYMSSSATNLLMPFYLEIACGYSPAKAGLILMATPVMMVLTAGPSGALSDRIGARIPATVGMSLLVIGLLSLRSLHAGAAPILIIPRLALIGLGIGLFTSPNNSAIMGSAPRNRQGVAGAILAAARNVGFTMGVAVGGVLYAGRLASLSSRSPSHAAAITGAVQEALTVIAVLAAIGVVVSAVRGRSMPGHGHH